LILENMQPDQRPIPRAVQFQGASDPAKRIDRGDKDKPARKHVWQSAEPRTRGGFHRVPAPPITGSRVPGSLCSKDLQFEGLKPDFNYVGNRTLCRWNRYHCVALRPLSYEREDSMLPTFRPTPTCTRFQATIEMPCMTCGVQMRLALIEPQGPSYNLLTYRCVPCDSGESFLKSM
jgi:hypothetical protein